ncbi:hypothetical protein DTO164E3_6965 [Paecilomyces variotii]|nr:hypothetical protein DTO164E3_6965 [Paecilomyces variotii]KAJ9204424.1 hypothetical protein DTO032I3_2679 [Paecilomyces variotii]KAJ9279094.1 hypothetical protein DTO021D3_4131 [Paecilomyces variotii]KAJ9344392.1 hypothetical protein DTO027B6_3010 [Paecilomyces variotii]KAJ9388249.1 hypothetical protein DTO032I4_2873 [Paecilomyces variotii]
MCSFPGRSFLQAQHPSSHALVLVLVSSSPVSSSSSSSSSFSSSHLQFSIFLASSQLIASLCPYLPYPRSGDHLPHLVIEAQVDWLRHPSDVFAISIQTFRRIKTVEMSSVHNQGQQPQVVSSDGNHNQQFQSTYRQDVQPAITYGTGQGYAQVSMNNGRDTNIPGLTHLLGGLNLPNQRPGAKYGAVKSSMPGPMGPNIEINGVQRPPYNGQLMLVPGGPMYGGMPQGPPYTQAQYPGHDQMSPMHYMPTGVYPGYVAGAPMIPGPIQHNAWTPPEENGPATPMVDASGHMEYYPMDRSTYMGYAYHTPPPQVPQPYLPYQMMKSPSGYVLQDLDALTQQDPPIPRAVPAMWTNPSDLTLAKCLENREGITNVYIRGFLPETTDEILHAYASRFGKIDRCKAIVDLETGLCKGFGFVQFFNFDSCENCIRGFFHLGYQASFAQKSRNSRLKDLEDKSSANIYCTNVPIDWTEADLRRHFQPYHVISEKISRDEKTGVSKEVGFARFESREIAEKVLSEFHNVTGKDGVKLLLRFADTKAQKLLKQQSNERRAYRAGEYNYSVEVVQGSTPSPSLNRLQQTTSHLSPNSQVSYPSPIGVGPVWTPATSISPSGPLMKNSMSNYRMNSWPSRTPLANMENTPVYRGRISSMNRNQNPDNVSVSSSKTALPMSSQPIIKAETPSPKKENMKAGSLSPIPSHKEVILSTPKSCM